MLGLIFCCMFQVSSFLSGWDVRSKFVCLFFWMRCICSLFTIDWVSYLVTVIVLLKPSSVSTVACKKEETKKKKRFCQYLFQNHTITITYTYTPQHTPLFVITCNQEQTYIHLISSNQRHSHLIFYHRNGDSLEKCPADPDLTLYLPTKAIRLYASICNLGLPGTI